MRATVGHSDDVDSADAIASVLAQVEEQLAGEQPKAGLLFASVTYDHAEVLHAIAARWPGLPLIGGSSDGEFSVAGFRRDSLLLVLLAGDGFEAHVGLGRDLSRGIDVAVEQATGALGAVPPALCLTTFAPSTNSSEVVRQLQRRCGASCPVVGGLTADHREYGRMVEFCGSEVLRDSLPVMFLTGAVHASFGIASGWFPMGNFHRVTSSDGHVVHTIDGQPATDVFLHYWGQVPRDSLGEYPLAVYAEGQGGNWSLRAALGSDPATGAIRFAGEIPQGSLVRVTEVLPDGILSGTTLSIEAALQAYPGRKLGAQPSLALLFSCAARRWVLGTEAEREFELLGAALQRQAATAVQLAGLYCYGEIAPPQPGASSSFHNETCVTLLLG